MSNPGFWVVLAVAVIGIAVIVWLQSRTRGPASTASRHDERPDTPNEQFYGRVDRPAGPDAEEQHPG